MYTVKFSVVSFITMAESSADKLNLVGFFIIIFYINQIFLYGSKHTVVSISEVFILSQLIKLVI